MEHGEGSCPDRGWAVWGGGRPHCTRDGMGVALKPSLWTVGRWMERGGARDDKEQWETKSDEEEGDDDEKEDVRREERSES